MTKPNQLTTSHAEIKIDHGWEVHYNRDSGIWNALPEPVNLDTLYWFLDPILDRCTHYLLHPGNWAQFWPSSSRESILDQARWQRIIPSSSISPERVEIYERIRRRLTKLLEFTENPVASVLQRCQQKNIRAGLTIRINDLHLKGNQKHPMNIDFRYDHPEYQFGEHGSMNYSLQPVRDEFITYLSEVCQIFDLQVLELDFLRRPPFFPDHISQTHQFAAGNELIEKACSLTQQSGVELQVRVPPAIELCENNGLDIRTWCRQGWITRIIPAPAYSMEFDLRLEEFKNAIGDQDIHLIPGLEKSFETHGPPRRYMTREMFRAAIARYYRAGHADGIHFFNLFGMPNGSQARSRLKPAEISPDSSFHGIELEVLEEAMKPEILQGRDKTYFLPPTSQRANNKGCVLISQLPMALPSQEHKKISLVIAENFLQESPRQMTMEIQIAGFPPEATDKVNATVNDHKIKTDISLESIPPPWLREKAQPQDGFPENPFYLAPRLILDTPVNYWRCGPNQIGITVNTPFERDMIIFTLKLEVKY